SSDLMDVRLTLRGLGKHPGFALVAALTLGIGIGANAAMFSFVDAVALRPLPFPDPDRLVQIWETAERDLLELRSLSFPVLEDLRREGTVLEDVAGVYRVSVNLTGEDEPERIVAEMVSPSYFRLLGLSPSRGRLFTEEEDRLDVRHGTAVVSEALWRRRFGADPEIVGSEIAINEVSSTIIGIVAGEGIGGGVALWVPLESAALFDPGLGAAWFENRGVRWLNVIGRLRVDTSPAKLDQFMRQETSRLRDEFPDVMNRRGVLALPVEKQLLGDVQNTASALMLAVVLVLLVACANLASLLIARAADRRREMELRLAVGASRGQITRQLLTESLVLAALGGAAGLLFALWAEDVLSGVSLFEELPSYITLRLGAKTIGFTAAMTLLTALVFGGALAAATARATRANTLHARATARWGRGHRLLVATQIGVALSLSIASALVLRNLEKALHIDPGFSAKDVLAFRVDLPATRYDGERAAVFARGLHSRIGSIAGVRSVALSTDVPLVDGYSALGLRIEERVASDPDERLRVYHHEVSPQFFSTLGIPLLLGRDFSWQDREGTPPVAIVTQRMADKTWPRENPIGKRVGTGGSENPWRTVVGVVGDIRYRNLVLDPVANPDDPDVFFPLAQMPRRELGVVLALNEPSFDTALAAVRRELRALDPGVPGHGILSMSDVVSNELALSKLGATLLSAFGAVAIALAALGVYGLLAQLVAARAFEIGIRIAVGARAPDIVRHVMVQGIRLVGWGALMGVFTSFALSRYVESLLVEISVTDPVAYAVGVGVLLALAGVACYLPARKAARVDPVVLFASRV
ncbi:MAG TPA: ABC transporter permease, partial [Vicinamibacteria bacterium]|nr:ABC transporter permease [Vicinamibacteria bacterium]